MKTHRAGTRVIVGGLAAGVATVAMTTLACPGKQTLKAGGRTYEVALDLPNSEASQKQGTAAMGELRKQNQESAKATVVDASGRRHVLVVKGLHCRDLPTTATLGSSQVKVGPCLSLERGGPPRIVIPR